MTVAEDLARRNGGEGVAMTGNLLETLPRSSVVLDDLQLPGSDASIEHLVIGPTGVFAVETERCADGVTTSRGGIRSDGLDRPGIAELAAHQAVVMTHVLAQPVRPVVVVQAAERLGLLSSSVIGGVRLCSPSQLLELLSDGEAVLEAHDVVSLALRASDRCVRQARAAAIAVA